MKSSTLREDTRSCLSHSDLVGKYMAFIVLVIAALALFAPNTVSFIKTSYVNTLLGIVMFGMGLTLKASDFKVVFSRPKDVIIGCVSQFTIMPLLAFLLTKLFNLPVELAVGVILVGTCPRRYLLQRYDLLSEGRRSLIRGHDQRVHHPGPVPDPPSDLRICRSDR